MQRNTFNALGLRVYTLSEEGYAVLRMPTIGENIRRVRLEKGFRVQGKLAKLIGVPQPRLSDWEKDRYGIPELPNLLKIAKALGVSLDDLLLGFDTEYDQIVRDLPRHTAPPESALPDGGARARNSTRLLAERLTQDRTLARRVQHAASELAAIAAILEEQAGPARGGMAGGPGRHRKAG